MSSLAKNQSANVSGAEIVFKDTEKIYPGQTVPAVNKLNLTIPAGEIVMFIGPSGCGKTTTLKMINRLHDPTSGTITIDGESITSKNPDELRRTIGYVIQGGSLFPHMTVGQNIALVPGLLKWDKAKTAKRVDELLDMVSLDPKKYRDRFPRELSGGQQQRVGVARGLAADPPVILMDEPFGAVDPITRQKLQDEMLAIQRELRKTIVCVTHDIDEAIKLGDRILLLREGAHIAQYDTPEVMLSAPANDFVADFIGSGSGIKQLSLARVEDLPLYDQSSAKVGESIAEVKARTEAKGDRSVIVLDDHNRPIDWVWLRSLQGDRIVAPSADRNLNTVDHEATLNDALDSMLASTHDGVVVTGRRDDYRGIVSFLQVTKYITDRAEQTGDQA